MKRLDAWRERWQLWLFYLVRLVTWPWRKFRGWCWPVPFGRNTPKFSKLIQEAYKRGTGVISFDPGGYAYRNIAVEQKRKKASPFSDFVEIEERNVAPPPKHPVRCFPDNSRYADILLGRPAE